MILLFLGESKILLDKSVGLCLGRKLRLAWPRAVLIRPSMVYGGWCVLSWWKYPRQVYSPVFPFPANKKIFLHTLYSMEEDSFLGLL